MLPKAAQFESNAGCAGGLGTEAEPQQKPDPALKGIKGGNCNLTACQKPVALYYNKSTEKYYCKACADEINWPGGRAETFRLYGTKLLCELDDKQNNEGDRS
jgi:hypothetical protein